MALVKTSPFNVSRAYNLFAFVIASSKLWFTWLWYNITCKIFMFFNMSIGIVKFAMIWKLTPFLTRIWLLPPLPFQGPSFFIIMPFFLIKQHILNTFILCFVMLFTQNPIFIFHFLIQPIWFILIIQISTLSCTKIQGHGLIILGFAFGLTWNIFHVIQTWFDGGILCSFF